MDNGQKINDADLFPLIEQYRGNLSAVARSLGVTRRAVYYHVNANPELGAALSDARESMLDNAESKLYQRTLEGHTAELLFFLKTQGKSRGYTERQELTGRDGGPIESKGEWDLKGLTVDDLRALDNILSRATITGEGSDGVS